jgi:MFS family permease
MFSSVTDLSLQSLIQLILVPVLNEFQFNGPLLSLAFNVGLFVGAIFWGFACDIWGRRYVPTHLVTLFLFNAILRWPFNMTFFIVGVIGLAAGGAPNFVGLSSLMAVLASGVGGPLFTSL